MKVTPFHVNLGIYLGFNVGPVLVHLKSFFSPIFDHCAKKLDLNEMRSRLFLSVHQVELDRLMDVKFYCAPRVRQKAKGE